MNINLCFLLIVLYFKIHHVLGKKVPPFMEDHNERNHRKIHSNAECLFGKQHKELGSSWFADLGPPFDVMYCIKCECVKIIKDGRILGHVKCRNIAKDCQELTCEDQIQVVGRCCKVCRNDTELSELLQDVTSVTTSEEEEKSYKHYAALLTSTIYSMHKKDAGNASSINSLGQTATGRFILHKRNLYYSFYTSMYPLPTRPKTIQFVDNSDTIVEEQQILSAGSLYQNITNKICGIWRRVPSEYRAQLKEEKLGVILIWEEYDLRIRGSLMRYRPLTTEIFSSLLVSQNDSLADSAGTAIISISTVTPTVHVMVIFTGLLNLIRKNDVLLQVKMFADDDKQTTIFEQTITIEKPLAELNVIEYSSAVTSNDLQAMTSQKVSLSLISARYKDSKIQGKVVPKVQCELFQAVLSSAHLNQAKYPQKSTKASGISWMFIDKNSALQYFTILDNVADVFVELINVKHQGTVENLSSIGWPNGTISVLTPKQLELLYNEELAINVGKINSNNPSLIRGRLVSRSVADSRDSLTPYLLKRSDTSVPADMVGLIWARIDGECNLYYDISIAGKDIEEQQYELYLEDIPFLAPGAPVTRRLLEEFSGTMVEGNTMGLSQNELSRLETAVVYLDIWNMKRGQSVLKTRWDKIVIPNTCLPHNVNSTADNNIASYRLLNDEGESRPEASKCYHGNRFYEDGIQWTSTLNDCNMCHCNHGEAKCDTILCPPLNCSQKFTISGSCCQSCYNLPQDFNLSANGCSLGGQYFAPGFSWYPYIPPNGFATCTVCQCDASTLQVKCGRVECPALNCDEKLAYRPDKKSCCKVCPNKTRTAEDVAISDQQDSNKYDRDILLAGGCKYPYGGPYENGKEWHPRIYFHGVQRCVTCHCKDGKVSCERKKCTKHSCEDPCCMKKNKCGKLKRNNEEARVLKSEGEFEISGEVVL